MKEDIMLKRIGITITGIFLFSMTFWFFMDHAVAEGEVVYLQNNIHYQMGPKDSKASYANWTDPGAGHGILPVNSAIMISRWRRGFLITDADDGMEIFFEFHKRNMDMSVDEYLELITSPSKVSLSGLSEKDKKGIQDGKAYHGMTKKGVRMALGYPAVHRTPSLDSNTWIYWTNRFRAISVEFDNQGRVQ